MQDEQNDNLAGAPSAPSDVPANVNDVSTDSSSKDDVSSMNTDDKQQTEKPKKPKISWI